MEKIHQTKLDNIGEEELKMWMMLMCNRHTKLNFEK